MCIATIEILPKTSDKKAVWKGVRRTRNASVKDATSRATRHVPDRKKDVWNHQGNPVIRFVIGEEAPEYAVPDDASQKADQLEYLVRIIYGVREGYVPISNVRLFTLLFLFDWSCLVRGLPTFTPSAQWRMGSVCAYPLDYYAYFKNKGYFEGKARAERERIWQADSRVLMQMSFHLQKPQAEIGSERQEAVGSVLKLLKRVAGRHGVDFSKSRLRRSDVSESNVRDSGNEFDSRGRFRLIDEDLLNYMLALDPFLGNLEIGQELNIVEYAKRYQLIHCSKRR